MTDQTTRTFTREQLEAWDLPGAWADDSPEILHREQVDSRRWVSVNELVFRAPDDGLAYRVFYDQGLTEHQDGTDPWNYDKEIKATEVEQRPVVTQQWQPVNAPRDKGLDTVLPAWEVMYEPGNVSDYLIGYANDEAAAKGAAEAWLRSQKDEVGRLEWTEMGLPVGDEYDRWFELVERHDDSIDTGPGITIRRRRQPAN
ncbi:hypothetical protein [Streptomyces sp. NPDC002758]